MSTFGRVLELLSYETKSQVLDMGVSQSRELKLYNMKTKMGLPENHPLQMKKTSLPYIHYCRGSILITFLGDVLYMYYSDVFCFGGLGDPYFFRHTHFEVKKQW